MPQAPAPKISLPNCSISKEVLRLVPQDLMRKHHFIPFDFEKDRLSIAIENPDDPVVIDQIRLVSGYELDVFCASKEAIAECLNKHLAGFAEQDSLGGLEAEDSNVVKVVQRLLELSVQRAASDIHLEPQEDGLFVRFRMDGILTTIHKLPKSLQRSATARVKVLASMDITEKRLPQDGQFTSVILRKNIDFRVSTLPGKYGEKVVIRVLDKSSFSLDLSQLGFEPTMQSAFETLIQKPQGLLLVTGPTGSGKTTTLYSVLNRLRSPLKNVITLEDPIEYELLAGKSDESGITQVQVNPKIGMTFAAGLRASLRQDPDIVMVGEIRDKETAEIAMKASLTGHLVLSTLHTNDSLSTVLRLKDMGVEPYLIGSTVIGVLAQRLVRVLCPHCREPYKPPAKALKVFFPAIDKQAGALVLYRARGCERCHFSGYHGRIGIFELLTMSEELRQFIQSGSGAREDIARVAVAKSMRESCLDLVKSGSTTVEEVFRTTVE